MNNVIRQDDIDLPPYDEDFIITEEIDYIIEDILNGDNVLITGNAGTGKTYIVKQLIQRHFANKNVATLAPTGVAALNVGGETIHRFFKFPPQIFGSKNIFKRSRSEVEKYRKLDLLFIDEVSMVRADLFDVIDKFLQINGPATKPFGGVQVVLVGDPFQLPPVLKNEDLEFFYKYYKDENFFSSRSYKKLHCKPHCLTQTFRQNDPEFVQFLNRLRKKELLEDDHEYLKRSVKKQVNVDERVILASTNSQVDQVNSEKLFDIPSEAFHFDAEFVGKVNPKTFAPNIPRKLSLKIGAKVMTLVNDPARQYVNGSIGWVQDIDSLEGRILVRFENGNVVNIQKIPFEDIEIVLNEKTNEYEKKVRGGMIQYPLRLAYAITIHKSQGLTFDKLHLDLKRMPFAHGQAYVALSRCKSFEGLSLSEPLKEDVIIVNRFVLNFYKKVEEEAKRRLEMKIRKKNFLNNVDEKDMENLKEAKAAFLNIQKEIVDKLKELDIDVTEAVNDNFWDLI